jgi:PIN domain nuclease of toxin-antitoxin system
MKYLLDTGAWLWSVAEPERLNSKAHELIAEAREELYLSAVSAWEIGIKTALGKLSLPEPAVTYLPKRLNQQGIRPLTITHAHALAVSDLPRHHTDPFDRLLIAQARMEGMAILTSDHAFDRYEVKVFWCGR